MPICLEDYSDLYMHGAKVLAKVFSYREIFLCRLYGMNRFARMS